MKKRFVKVLSLILLSAGLLFGLAANNSVKADINPECPNGCVAEYSGCYCYQYYPWFTEASW